jgi:hypothetical protein
MSDYDTDIDTGVEDFDTTEPTTSVSDRQGDATDAIAQMLVSGDTSHLDNFDGETEGAFKMGHVRDSDGTERAPKQAETPSYHGNRSAPDVQNTQGQIEHFTAQNQAIAQEWQHLQEMQQDMPPEVFAERAQFLQGKAAGSMIALQQAQLQFAEEQQWLAQQEALVREKHADVFNDPQQRQIYSKKMLEVLGEVGYSGEELMDIGGREFNFVLDHIKLKEAHDQLKMENAVYKREAKQRAANINRGRRDSEVGAKGTKGVEAQQDEIMKVLFGGGR